MAKREKPVEIPASAPEVKFSKHQLLASKKYAHRRDLLGALLEDGRQYGVAEVDALIQNYNERKM